MPHPPMGATNRKDSKMTRNLKALGPALVAAFAFAAVSASSALAVTEPVAHFTASEYPSYIEGNQIGNHTFTTPLGTITCTTAHFTSKANKLTAAATSLTVTPEYTGCSTKTALGAEYPTTVTNNGCTYTFTVHEKGTTTNGNIETPSGTVENAITHTWTGDVHIKCPEGVKGIEVHAYENVTKHTNDQPICTYTVKPQTVNNIVYRVHTVGGVSTYTTVEAKNSEVKINRTSGIFTTCGGAEPTAKYNGNTTVETLNNAGAMIQGGIDKVTT